MVFIQAQFDKAVWNIVARIPVGQIMSYGEIARFAGYPRHARMVSKAMSRSPVELPWYRVVRADKSIAFPKDSSVYQKQLKLLKNEGVLLVNGKVICPQVTEDLDKLIWGPDSGNEL